MTNGISNLQPGEPNKLLDSILANLPAPIPVDAPIGQWHLDWFLWFIDTGVPYVVQVHEEEPLESLDWRRLGFPLYVGYAWDWLVGEFGYQWDINTLNWILAHWGDGGFVGDDIPTTTGISGVFTTPDGLTGNTALGTIITTSNAINLLPNLYGNAFKEKETSTTPTISPTTEPSHKGAYRVFESGTSNYIVYAKGDTVSYKNTTYIANKETKGGNRPDKSIDWDKVSEADITGIAITADAGLTGTMWTRNGFHYQDITVATGGITTAHIADNAITSSKIADGAILGVDVAVGVTLTNPDITGDIEMFGQVTITGTAGVLENTLDPILTIKPAGRNRPAIEASGGISMGSSEIVVSQVIGGISGQSGSFARVKSTGLVIGNTGEFTDVVLTKGLSAQDGAIEGYTGDFNNIVAHGGISANGLTLSHLARPFLGLIASATVISAGQMGLNVGASDEVRISGGFGVSAGGNIIKGNTGDFNQVVANSGITAKGISTDNIHVKSGISAGTLVTGFTAEFTSLVGAKGVSAAGATIGGYWAGQNEEVIGIAIDNGLDVITTGKKGHRVIPYDCEVTEWTVTSSDSGSIQFDVNWCTYANWTTTASVAGSGLPSISSSTKNQDTSVNWTKTTFDAGNIMEFEVDSVTTLTNCILSVKIRRTG